MTGPTHIIARMATPAFAGLAFALASPATAQDRATDFVQVLAGIEQPIPQVGVSPVASVRLGNVTFARLPENICIYTLTPDGGEQVQVLNQRTGVTTVVGDNGVVTGCTFRPGEVRQPGSFSIGCGAGLSVSFSMVADGAGSARLNPLSNVLVRTSDSDPGKLLKGGSGFTCPASGLLAVDVGIELRLSQTQTQPNSQIGTLSLNAIIQ